MKNNSRESNTMHLDQPGLSELATPCFLCAIASAVDVIGFLPSANLFTAHMTDNIVFWASGSAAYAMSASNSATAAQYGIVICRLKQSASDLSRDHTFSPAELDPQ
jgi:hypothetical protein